MCQILHLLKTFYQKNHSKRRWRTSSGTDVAVVAVHNSLEHSDALGAEAFGLGGDVDTVVEVDLAFEVDIVVDYHHGEVALLGRQAAFGEEGLLAEVEVFHDDGVVDVAHLVHIVESDLYINHKLGIRN